MIAKIIVHGNESFWCLDEDATRLYELEIDDVMTNSDFQLVLISDSNAIAGDYDTAFLMESILPNYRKINKAMNFVNVRFIFTRNEHAQLQGSLSKEEVDEIFSQKDKYMN